MNINLHGVLAEKHWARMLPRQYAANSGLDESFTALGEEAIQQIDDVAAELVGEINHSDSYLVHAGRLAAARAMGRGTHPARTCTARP